MRDNWRDPTTWLLVVALLAGIAAVANSWI